jgi:hypothetical protein
VGDAKRKREAACTCPLVSVTEIPPVDPKCPIHGAGADARAAADRGITPIPAAAPAAGGSAELNLVERLDEQLAQPNHWQDPAPDPMAFRCPHCGAWRPAYGFSGQRAELPGVGTAEMMAVFCGSCKVLLQLQLLDIRPGAGGRGRTN